MNFFEELKRRNVIRVGIAYIVGSWLLIQGADLVFDLIGADDWVLRAVAGLLALGFIPAIAFAWAFEITPEGIKKEKDVDRTSSITHHTAKKLDIATMVLVLAAIGLLALDRFIPSVGGRSAADQSSDPRMAPAHPCAPPSKCIPAQKSALLQGPLSEPPAIVLPEPNSVAVLPFADLSPESDQQYFSDGISEELLNLLAGVDGLKVASRTSSFAYKGLPTSVPQIASELKVANILEGSVRKAGNRVRITAQLIDTREDRHLWSETYDRDLVDIFAIQDEIATAIVEALKEQLGVNVASENIVVAATTENLDAYELYLKGRTLFTARQNLDVAISLFKQAIELDPNYARAWEGLAAAEAVANDWNLNDGIDHIPLAYKAAQRAVELDPELSLPYAVMGNINFMKIPETEIPDLTESLRMLDLAIEKDPKNTTALLWRGIAHYTLADFDKGLADLDQCLAVDPDYLNCQQHGATVLLLQGHVKEALAAFTPSLYENFHSMDEAFVPVLVDQGNSIAAVLMVSARMEARYAPVGEWIKALEHPDSDHSAGLAKFDLWNAQQDQDYGYLYPDFMVALGAYEKAATSPNLRWTLYLPSTKGFRESPYFKPYVTKLGFVAYWRKNGFPPFCKELNEQDFECD